MGERATVFNGVQFGSEVTPGTLVPGNKTLATIDIQPGIKGTGQIFKPMGQKFATAAIPGREWTESKMTGTPSFGELPFIWQSLLKKVTPTAGGATSKVWTWVPSPAAEDTYQTYSVEAGSSFRAGRFPFGFVNGATFTFKRDGITFEGTMIGSKYEDGITLTAAPTALDSALIMPAGSGLTITLADTWAGLPGTVTAKVLQAVLAFNDYRGTFWYADASKTSFGSTVEKSPASTLKLTVEADANGMGLLTQMRAGSMKYVQISVVGPLIEASHNYTFETKFCGLIPMDNGVSEFKDEDGVYAIEFTLQLAKDTSGNSLQVKVENLLASI